MTPILIRALCLIEHKHEVFLLRKHEKGKLRVMLKAVMNSLNCFDVSEEALISKDINRQLKKDGKVHNFNKHVHTVKHSYFTEAAKVCKCASSWNG